MTRAQLGHRDPHADGAVGGRGTLLIVVGAAQTGGFVAGAQVRRDAAWPFGVGGAGNLTPVWRLGCAMTAWTLRPGPVWKSEQGFRYAGAGVTVDGSGAA